MLQTPTLSQAETNQVAGEATEPGQDLSHVGRFAVRATVAGDFRPGGLIQVTATVRANFPTKDAEIRIEAPEIQLLKTGAFSRGGRITGITISPEASERAITLAIGTARTLHTTLTVSEPGYYRVLVGGRAPNESPIAQGKTVQNVVYDEVWFTVVDQGGRVTGGYDVSAYPSGVIPQPGPFRGSVQSSPEANKPASAAIVTESAVQTVLTNDPMTLQVSYYNRDASAFEPLVDARYRLVVTSGGSSTTYTGQLNSNGEFAFPCATSPTAGGMLDVWYESPGRVSVIRHGTVGTLTLHYAISVTLCGSYTSAGVDQSLNGNAAARVFTNALIGVNTSRTLFPTRATISYKMSTIVPDTYYSKSDDRIQIDTGATWGSYGIFAAAHEYGHALHHTALGGIKTNSGTCGEEHFYDGYYNYGCAYSEGFADYHAAIVRGSAGDFFVQTRDGLNHEGQDGATNEGGVASFLYDLTDPANDEPFDAVQYPTWYVADIYRTCDAHLNVGPINQWQRASGIDHMVYCFEQTVDPVARAFFHGGSTAYDAQRESATEPIGWLRSAIRNIWLYNLYNQ